MILSSAKSLLLLIVLIGSLFPQVTSFSQFMLKDFCSRNLEEGEIIMNSPVTMSEERVLRVFLGDEELNSGDVYRIGDVFTIKLSEGSGEFVFETNENGEFIGDAKSTGCGGRRAAGRALGATLRVADEGFEETLGDIEIWAAWAMGHEQVKITEKIILTSDIDSNSVKEGTGYFFERNKAAVLKKAEARALVEDEEKGLSEKEDKKEEIPIRVKTLEKKAPVAEPLMKTKNDKEKQKPGTIMKEKDSMAISKTIQRDRAEGGDDDDMDDQTDDEFDLDGKKNGIMVKLADPMFDVCLVVGVGLALFALYKVSSSRFKIRKAVESIRGETHDN